MRIYNGPNTTSPLLELIPNNQSGVVTGTSGCLTIEFTSGSFTYPGWRAAVSCSCLRREVHAVQPVTEVRHLRMMLAVVRKIWVYFGTYCLSGRNWWSILH